MMTTPSAYATLLIGNLSIVGVQVPAQTSKRSHANNSACAYAINGESTRQQYDDDTKDMLHLSQAATRLPACQLICYDSL